MSDTGSNGLTNATNVSAGAAHRSVSDAIGVQKVERSCEYILCLYRMKIEREKERDRERENEKERER